MTQTEENFDGSPAEPTDAEIAVIVNQPEVLAERRRGERWIQALGNPLTIAS